MARMRASGIQECKFSMGSLGVHVHMFSIGDQRSDRKKFIHQFENVTSIVFSVDLGNYDQVLPGASNQQNLLMESLSVFGSMVNSRWFLRTSIILLLCNAELFRRKLGRTPMNRYFPHYGGGNDVSQASKYIIERFHYLNMNNLSLFPRLCEASGTCVVVFYMSCCLKSSFSVKSNANSEIWKHIDPSNLQIVFTAVQDTIIFNNMKDSGIAVERKNSATSTASSSRKGSNDSAIEDERGLGRGNEVQGTRKERDAHPALRFYSRWDKGKEDKVREEWKEHREDNASRQVAENGDAGEDGNETEPEREVIPSEIGVAL
jgi:guanine nucleotide-binding protein G(i) subunit alpha